jgi:hypothetical protein
MKIIFSVTFCLFLSLSSCLIRDNSQPFEMTATVLDMSGKPIKDREVRVFVRTQPFSGLIFNDEQTHAFGVTDEKGQVVLKYSLDIDDTQQFATVFANEDDVFRTVSVITHSSSGNKTDVVKKSGTIQMDSLVPFTLRLKTDRVDVRGLNIFMTSGQIFSSVQNTTNIQRTFTNVFSTTNTPKLDTLITTKVYSKAEFSFISSLSLANSPYSISKGIVKFERNQDRSGVYLQTF